MSDDQNQYRRRGQSGSPDLEWRIGNLERKAQEIERRADEIKGPMRDAVAKFDTFQAGAVERERRREEQFSQLRSDISDLRQEHRQTIEAIKQSIPNKAINDLIVKVVLGLIGMILVAVVSLWLGVLGVKQ